MKFICWLTVLGLSLSLTGASYAGEIEKEKKGSSGNEALTGAVMGGLLGAGLGAAIGSASGKAGQGAAIGAGVGAVGGTLLGAGQAAKKEDESSYGEEDDESAPPQDEISEAKTVSPKKIKKRIIREYDEEGNVISEKEVAN